MSAPIPRLKEKNACPAARAMTLPFNSSPSCGFR